MLEKAASMIKDKVGDIILSSKIYESTPWRVDGQANYLNQILLVSTALSAEHVLKNILQIESNLGRLRYEKWGERLIDVDIVFFNDDIIDKANLCIPHKHMHERNFVLKPLNEIAPDFIHPKFNKTVSELFENSKDTEKVEQYAI